ncbi:LysR family transcriptional activator of nhaA [Paraburkholderia sp. Clong3]
MHDEVREAASGTVARFAVGLTDGISKLAVHAILAGVLDTPSLRLLCHEGEAEDLLAELAHHHLDLVLSSQPAPHNSNLRLSSERLIASPIDWYGPAAVVRKTHVDHFPQCLASRGMGVFPLAAFGAERNDPMHRGLRWLGRSPEVKEEIHAIVSRRGRHHPLTQKVLSAAHA